MGGFAAGCASLHVTDSNRQDNGGMDAHHSNNNDKVKLRKVKQMKKKAHAITMEEVDAATTALKNQHGTMHFLLPVLPEARGKTRRLATKAYRVTEKRLKAAREHGEALPASFDLRGFERDVTLMKSLEQCRDMAARIHSDVQDTLNQVATEAFRAGIEAYGHIKVAFTASPGLKRTVGDLSARRPKPGKEPPSGTPAAGPPPPAPAAPAAQAPPQESGPGKKAA